MIPLYDDNPTRRFPWLTLLLIGINAGVFFYWQIGVAGLEQSVRLAAFVPAGLNRSWLLESRNLFTSMFMHGSIMHLLGNMWFLWLFGNNVEDVCGRFNYLFFYLLCGICATLSYTFYNLESRIPLLGASGAISGVLGAYMVLFPGKRVLTLIPLGLLSRTVRMPAWVFLLVWLGFQLLSQWLVDQPGSGGVAFLAHIGGFLAGILLIFFFKPKKRKRHRS